MELEAVRMAAVAAADPTIGINAMLAALPIDAEDDRPEEVTIYNAGDDRWVARQMLPEIKHGVTLPAIAVLLASKIDIREVNTTVRDAEIPIMFAYIVADADSAKATRDAMYLNRATLRFLRRLADNAGAPFRARNGVQLINPIETTQGPTNKAWDKVTMVSATVITWLARETAA